MRERMSDVDTIPSISAGGGNTRKISPERWATSAMRDQPAVGGRNRHKDMAAWNRSAIVEVIRVPSTRTLWKRRLPCSDRRPGARRHVRTRCVGQERLRSCTSPRRLDHHDRPRLVWSILYPCTARHAERIAIVPVTVKPVAERHRAESPPTAA